MKPVNRRLAITPYLLATMAGFFFSDGAEAGCREVIARVVVIQGAVESQRARNGEWRAAANAEGLCVGDRVRTLERSRATLQLNDETYVSLDQRTTIVLSGLQAKMPSWLDLLKGVMYLRSRTPSSLDIKTPFINAAIKGTEFLVASDDREGQVTVFEGRVDASNPKGTIPLTSGQTAVAQAGQAPVRKLLIAPPDAVQWALYYPPLIDLENLRKSASDPAVKRAAAIYLAGDNLGALRELEAADQPHAALRAALLLGLGRVDEAQPLIREIPLADKGQALALRSVIALARNDKALALQLAEQATSIQPKSPVSWTALSYARQAQFDLEAALASARKAAELAPDNGLTQTRLAELLDATGKRNDALRAAERAVQLNPGLARAWVIRGFSQLTAMNPKGAMASFSNAMRIDSSDPLVHFGLGLARIREGYLEEGTEDIEIAASLDPNDGLTRSYLGKAYYEQKRNSLAETEYKLAKQFDPNDPTPWFYDAIKKRTENRPIEALHNMQESISLNDNRAVYRSRQMLDDDLAARSANLARTYDNLGFRDRARLEGWKSVTADSANFSAHRFLSDSYSTLENQRAARVSELLQSQLFQPANLTPIPAELAEADLAILQGAGPSDLSFNEFNPLFVRDGAALQVNAIGGNRGTFGDDLILSGIKGPFSGSLGQFHYGTEGVRRNNDLANDVYNMFGQLAVTPDFSLQTEIRHSTQRNGDLFRPEKLFTPQGLDPSIRQTLTLTTERFGFHYKPVPNQDVIASYQHVDNEFTINKPNFINTVNSHNGDIQYLIKAGVLNPIVGASYLSAEFTAGGARNPVASNPSRYANGYLYLPISLGQEATMTFGLSIDNYNDGNPKRNNKYNKTRLNPKFGLIWSPTDQTTFRVAAFRSMKRQYWARQVLEPTQLAGFNQIFDDLNGTDAIRYGFGLDHRFTRDALGGWEVSWRNVSVPTRTETGRTVEAKESSYRTYLNWAINEHTALAVRYAFSEYQNSQADLIGVGSLATHQVPFSLNYFDDSGFFAKLSAAYVNQHANIDPQIYAGRAGVSQNDIPSSNNESFWILDASLGVRLPRRFGIISIEGTNLLGEDFIYLPNINPDEPKLPTYLPGRMIFSRINLFFN